MKTGVGRFEEMSCSHPRHGHQAHQYHAKEQLKSNKSNWVETKKLTFYRRERSTKYRSRLTFLRGIAHTLVDTQVEKLFHFSCGDELECVVLGGFPPGPPPEPPTPPLPPPPPPLVPETDPAKARNTNK